MILSYPIFQNFLAKVRHILYFPSASWNTPTRNQVATWGLLLVLALIISVSNYQAYQLGTSIDDAHYVILARSLAYSDAYGMINSPGEPGTTQYPFGYPLLLSPFVLLLPDHIDLLKALSLFATLVNASLLFWGWRWLSRSFSYWWGIAVVALYLLTPLTIDHTRRVMSEPFFMTFCLISLLLAERGARGERGFQWSLLLSISLVFSVFTRTVGVITLLVVFVYLFFMLGRKAERTFILIVVQMAVLISLITGLTVLEPKNLLPTKYLNLGTAPIILRSLGFTSLEQSPIIEQSTVEYSDEGKTFAEGEIDTRTWLGDHFLRYVPRYLLARYVRGAVLPLGGGDKEELFAERVGLPHLPLVVGFAVITVILIGYFRWLASDGLSVFWLFSVIYLGSMLLWRWDGPRLTYPILPQLQFAFLLGIATVLLGVVSFLSQSNHSSKLSNLALVGAALVLISISAYKSFRIDSTHLHVGDLEVRSNWLKENSSPGDTVMTEAPEIDYLYSGHKTVHYPTSCSLDSFVSYLEEHHVDFVLIAPKIKWQSNYVPAYSDKTKCVLGVVTTLMRDNQVKQVYSSKSDLVRVFKTQNTK